MTVTSIDINKTQESQIHNQDKTGMTIYGKYSGNLSTCNLAIPNMILSIASHGSDLARLIASLKSQGIKPVGTDMY
ncbi:MAG: hypothetical protein EBT59_09340 [Betaproteobacteria bacterium]|nr:hypothetical protein [Betaproteobacteria bacterium]NBT99333.1 hypothetical protein [Betaproteobacteria bacterium]NCX02469.1 hypothetical protein [Betaproteobacteria bacterium]NDE32554.1 hypothetical protein [Betaproteobacteria bacterium]